jgi:asparagine synthase (glutamine-hydrolysing)
VTALAGLWSFGSSLSPDQCVERMLRGQQVYAPAAPAHWSGGEVALGRRLFSLLPEDRFDRGPVVRGDHVLVADLRLDNREELCADLRIGGGDAGRMSDAEVLAQALEQWGLAAVERLVGDFAFAWWNGDLQRMVLARDFLGQRPLHYHQRSGFFAFASMPKGLHALPEIARAPDHRSVADFLALVPEGGSESYFEGIAKVPPGHVVTVTRSGLSSTSYWQPRVRELGLRSDRDYEEALAEQLDRAVACRLRGSPAGIGAHLSAGLDSAAVAATAARLLAPDGAVTAFTSVPRAGYPADAVPEAIVDEGELAAQVAGLHSNIEHVLVRGCGKSPTADLSQYFFLFERPFLNLCNGVWITAILDEAKRRGLSVMLTGALGNASFSYDGMERLPQLLKRGRLPRLCQEAWQLKRGGVRAGTIAAQAVGPFLPPGLWTSVNRILGRDRSATAATMIDPKQLQSHVEQRAVERGLDLTYRPATDPVESRLWVLRRVDGGNYKKGMLGGWGVDQRDPAADRRLVEFCLSVPVEQFLARGVPRSLARRALADRVPASVLRERRKGYQAADWHEGLAAARGDLPEEIDAIEDCGPAAAALDTKRMRRLITEWPEEGSWHDPQVTREYRSALLRGVAAGRFIRQAMGSNR